MTRVEQLAEGVNLYLGDCREVLPTLGRFDAIITDPPYGIGWDYASYVDTFENWRELVDIIIPIGRKSKAMSLSVGPLEAEAHIFRHHSPKWRACWYRGSTGARSPMGFRDYETVFLWGDVPRPMHDFFSVTPETNDRFGHTCPKPVGYAEWLVHRMTLLGERVCDPFLGSGTTGVAAVKLGRRFTGIEIDPGYFDIACRRIEAALKEPDFFVEPPKPAKQEALL